MIILCLLISNPNPVFVYLMSFFDYFSNLDSNASISADSNNQNILRQIQVLAHSKKCSIVIDMKQNELQVPLSSEDKDMMDAAIAKMKALDGESSQVLIIQLERLLCDNKLEDALELVRVKASDSKYARDVNLALHVILIKTQACFASFQNPSMTEALAEAMLQDINNEYNKVMAIDQEDTNVDIVGQYSQFLVMSGKFQEAKDVLTMALPYARSKEELKLILQMLEGVLTNLYAADLFKKINMPK
jgi:hypothetical protein